MANEKRLIDAVRYGEVLERYINAPHAKVFGKYSDGMQLAISTCIELLNSQRTVDAVEVVRCCDCVFAEPCNASDVCVECNQFFGMAMDNDWFCADGERRTDV